MTPEQKTLIKTTWNQVVPIADTAAQLFYGKLFEIDPSTRPMFKSADMPEQRKKLMQALATVIAGLDNLAPLIPVLQTLGKKHVAYGVLDKHYDSVGAALLWTLEQGLQTAWTPPVKDAWVAAYTAVAGVMIMKLRIVSLAIAGAVAGGLLVMPDNANARIGNSSFAGSKGVSSRPAPTPPRTTERPQLVHTKLKLLRCYHTRGRSQYGVHVHRTHCG